MSINRCKHGNVISDTRGNFFTCAECDPKVLEEHIEVLRNALKLATARLARVDGADTQTFDACMKALNDTGEAFDVDAFIKSEDQAVTP